MSVKPALVTAACAGMLSLQAGFGPTNNPEDQWRCSSTEGIGHIREFARAGFNTLKDNRVANIWKMSTDREQPNAAQLKARLREHAAEAVRCGVGIMPYFRYCYAECAKQYPRVNLDGSLNDKRIDGFNAQYQAGLRRAIEAEAAAMKGIDGIIAINVASEMRDAIGPSFTPATTNAYRRFSGHDIPKEAIGRNPIPWTKIADFPADRIVSDDYPILNFYEWVWKEGDGWPSSLDLIVDTFTKGFGRELPMLFDPVNRIPSMWGTLGPKITQYETWVYGQPEPFRLLYVISQLQAIVRERGDRDLMIGIQAIMYRNCTAPIGKKVKALPAWAKEFPNARYITPPPDNMEETMWHAFSRKTDGYFFHHETSLFDMTGDHLKNGYQCTNPECFARIGRVFNEVGIPLGPLFRAVPEREPVVAILESKASQILGAHLTWAPNEYYSSAMFVADAANLSPYVIYEDEIRERGIPPSVKVVVLPKCEVLTRSAFDALMAFRKRGGRLVGDKLLLKAIVPDATFLSLEDEEKNTHGDFDDGFQGRFLDAEKRNASVQETARKLKDAVGIVPYADSDRPDILVHARTYGRADYVFAVNDRRTVGDYVGAWRLLLEKGLPNEGLITVQRPAGAVYDLVKHEPVSFEVRNGVTRIPVRYATTDGRCLMLVDRPLAALSIRVAGTSVVVTSPDREAMIPIRLDGVGAKPWYAVVKDGVWRRDFGFALEKPTVTNLADDRVARTSP